MKKIALLVVTVFAFGSCAIDEESSPGFYPALVPVVSVEMPNELVFGEKYTFDITYKKPSSCHIFAGFSYEQDRDVRIVGAIMNVFTDETCEDLTDKTETKGLDFEVRYNEPYIFKFWQGRDENGNDIYLVKKVPVVMPSN